MALSIALPLSGVEAEHFYALGAQFLYNNGLRSINGIGPHSPSIDSESSSGFGSLTPSIESIEHPELEQEHEHERITHTPSSSRSSSPITSEDDSNDPKIDKEIQHTLKYHKSIKVMYDNRDILNLGANIRDPSWMLMRCPGESKQSNEKVYDGLPNFCDSCNFQESVYIP